MQWGPDADAKLFMHVLKIHNVKLDYTALALAMGNDVTPKALTHRIAKLRSMAEDASTPVAGASSGLGLPQPNKRTTPAKRAPATPSPAGKKAATAANKTPVAGSKRTAAGTAKKVNGKTDRGRALLNVVAASNGNGNGDAGVKDDEVEVEVQTPSKKVKTVTADKGKVATVEDGIDDAGTGEGGAGYA